MYYVYQHIKADTNAIFYIGKGKGRRVLSKTGRSVYWKNTVAKHGLAHKFLAKNLDEELAFLVEVEAIDQCRLLGISLVNRTDGGEGASGYKHTDEHKAKMIGNPYGRFVKKNGFKGKTHSDEQKQKWAITRKGVISPRKGVTLSEETKQKMSAARKGIPLEDSHKKAISTGLLGNKHTAKLSDDDVKFIRANQGVMTHIDLGARFGVHRNTIHKIWRNERYKDVK